MEEDSATLARRPLEAEDENEQQHDAAFDGGGFCYFWGGKKGFFFSLPPQTAKPRSPADHRAVAHLERIYKYEVHAKDVD